MIRYLLLLLWPLCLSGQKLLSPAEFHHHSYGEAFTPHHALVDYVQHVAEHSPHVQVQEYGRSYEGRPLLAVTISSRENLNRLEDIRKSHLFHLGLSEGGTTIRKKTAIVWLSFGVHGNEAAASESAMHTLYHLADPRKQTLQKWLQNTIVILDPCLNPDGFDRYVNWYKSVRHKTPNVHLQDREHQEPWPQGRYNHYHFDLNRDWVWQTQIETKQRMKLFQQWMPHVHVDVHEMGIENPYFFAPAASPIHDYVSDWQKKFQELSGKNHRQYFDRNGWLYYTEEVFDLFYPSYGDTYPTFNGAIGMTYEQGGSHRAGRAVITESGDTLTLAQRIEHHKTTCLSTVEMASKQAEQLVEEMRAFFAQAKTNPPGKYQAYLIRQTPHSKGRIQALLDLLDAHQIRYGQCGRAGTTSGFDFQTAKTHTFSYQKEDLLIPVGQPKGTLLQVLMEPQSNLEDSLTYDITAWSLPYAYNLDAFGLTETWQPVKEGVVVADTQRLPLSYAYAIPWNTDGVIPLVSAVLQEGIQLRYAKKPFRVENQSFDQGTILVYRADNRSEGAQLPAILERLSAPYQIAWTPIATGWTTEGPDLGSDHMALMSRPKVMLWSDESVDATAFGQFWHLFDEEWGYSLTIGTGHSIRDLDLDGYTHLILPEGRYPSAVPLQEWIQEGGTVLAIGSAIRAFEDDERFDISKADSAGTGEPSVAVSDYDNRSRHRMSRRMAGAIVEVQLDGSHPLAYGLGERYFTLKDTRATYDPLTKGWNVGIAQQARAGFVGSHLKGSIAGKLSLGVLPMRRGRVVYMVDNPIYRSFWVAGKQLVANAIFFN